MTPRWCQRCRRELAGADDREREQLVCAAIVGHLGIDLIAEKLDAALIACARAGATPRRQLLIDLVGAELAPLVEREIDRRIQQLDRERERAA